MGDVVCNLDSDVIFYVQKTPGACSEEFVVEMLKILTAF
jgi:hypothetical protein